MRRLALAVLVVIAAVLGLLMAPSALQPVAWTPPPAPSLDAGAYRANQRLRRIESMAAVDTAGPESVAVDGERRIIAGYTDGRVIRFDADGSHPQVLVNTGGRPLGIKIHPDGSLYVADAIRGLVHVTADGQVQQVSAPDDGLPVGWANDLAIDARGDAVYYSDSSSKFGWGHDQDDVIEHGGHGRLIRLDVASGRSHTLLGGLQFANGVALGPDDDYVLVDETGAYRVTRYWLKGPKAGTSDTFVDDLPGMPDNITFNGRDRFWVALFAPRNPLLDALSPHPLVRRALARIAGVVRRHQRPHAIALAFDPQGHLLSNLQASGPGTYFPMTSVLESGPNLYFGSIFQPGIGRMPLRDAEDAPPG